jgi:hypothetical protein
VAKILEIRVRQTGGSCVHNELHIKKKEVSLGKNCLVKIIRGSPEPKFGIY